MAGTQPMRAGAIAKASSGELIGKQRSRRRVEWVPKYPARQFLGDSRMLGVGERRKEKKERKEKKHGPIEEDVEMDDPEEQVFFAGSYDSSDNIFDDDAIGSPIIIETEDEFVTYCQEQLLSMSTSDGLVSQNDVAIFITDICDIMDDEDLGYFACPTPQFTNLAIEVQASFVWYICPNDEKLDILNCLADLLLTGEDFGYPVGPGTEEEAKKSILGFCCSLLPFVDKTNIDSLDDPGTCPVDLPGYNNGVTRGGVPKKSTATQPPIPRPSPSVTTPPAKSLDAKLSSSNNVPSEVVVGNIFGTKYPEFVMASQDSSGFRNGETYYPGAAAPQTFQSKALMGGATIGIMISVSTIVLVFLYFASERRRRRKQVGCDGVWKEDVCGITSMATTEQLFTSEEQHHETDRSEYDSFVDQMGDCITSMATTEQPFTSEEQHHEIEQNDYDSFVYQMGDCTR